MKTFILILIIYSFLQIFFIPINLVIILLISRSLSLIDQANLAAAFLGGILLGLLSAANLGFWALVFLMVVKLIELIKKLPFSVNILTIIPVSLLLILVVEYSQQLLLGQTLSFTKVIVETVLVLPTYFVFNLLERGTFTPELKLRRQS